MPGHPRLPTCGKVSPLAARTSGATRGGGVEIELTGDRLVPIEAVFGQFYVAIVVAQIIGMKLAQALTPPGPDPK